MSKVISIASNSKLTTAVRLYANVLISQKRFVQAPKRFYKNVSISQSNGIFEVNLDKRKLKTPMGKVFQVPNEALAVAVAAEWSAQDKIIRQSAMHLTNLSNTAIDNPMHRTKEELAASVLEYLGTDTICYTQEEPAELAKLQAAKWGPVQDWFCKRFNVDINLSNSIVAGPTISDQTKENITRHLLSYDFWSLIGMNSAVDSLKSVILTLSTVDCHLSVEEAVFLSRLELEFQITNWGNVEWAHEVELMDLRARVAAGIMFVHFSRQTFSKNVRTLSKQSNRTFV